ncbi:YdcF family protein [Ahrensia sp. 13_GOM-1096m]|uniref:YdcF family protein n=1 Tax=Ahrensia sp. 13_GOM-1096m TaxID=1380380 RepID=UPI000686ED37|nr:YdcF family protein [Ahrensia sp. 13_GOM-1096m]
MFAFLLLLSVLLLTVGFGVFLTSVDRHARNQSAETADGIVVLTGGFARLEPAIQLLREKRGERLLISGVNRKTDDQLLKHALDIEDKLFNCCVDIDQDALDTIGNALGTAHWAASKDYKSLLVVTNDYHMPRSLMELRREIGDIELLPYAIRNRSSGPFTMGERIGQYRVLLLEYGKLVATFLRAALHDGRIPALK